MCVCVCIVFVHDRMLTFEMHVRFILIQFHLQKKIRNCRSQPTLPRLFYHVRFRRVEKVFVCLFVCLNNVAVHPPTMTLSVFTNDLM